MYESGKSVFFRLEAYILEKGISHPFLGFGISEQYSSISSCLWHCNDRLQLLTESDREGFRLVRGITHDSVLLQKIRLSLADRQKKRVLRH